MQFKPYYFYLTLLLFVVEVCIALFVDDRIVRPLIGDVLVIILIYCFLRAFWAIRVNTAIALVFGLACVIELMQLFRVIDRLGLRQNTLVATVLGTTFDWKDLVAYALGAAILWGWEQRSMNQAPK